MDKPTVTEQINGYKFEWLAPHHLVAQVTRVRTPSDGQVRGELAIFHLNGKAEVVLLVPTQFNFSSEPTRVRYAKQLAEKLDIKIEWKEIIDYISNEVLHLARCGDEPVEVYPNTDTPPPQRLLGDLVYKGVQNIIFGEKGVSKSTLAYLLGMCVALPWCDNPLELATPKESVKVLVADWETEESIFRYVMSRLQRGMDIPPCSLNYRRCTLPLVEDIEAIQRHIDQTGAKLLIIDSLGAAAGGERDELKNPGSALMFNAVIRKLEITTLIIAQTSKGSEEDGKKKSIYGTTFFRYYARNIFELCAGEDEYGDTQHLGLFHRDCNLGPKMKPMGFRLEFSPNGAIALEREPISVAEFAQKLSTSARILEALKDGKMTQKDLKESLEVSYPTIGMALKRLKRQGKVQQMDKEWGLLSGES